MTFSRILESVRRRLIGLNEEEASEDLSVLCISIIMECFQMEGIYDRRRMLLNIDVRSMIAFLGSFVRRHRQYVK